MSLDTPSARVYRALYYGERPVRRTCPRCHDRHLALVNWRTRLLQCRACGQVVQRPFAVGIESGSPQVRRGVPDNVLHCEDQFVPV